MGTRYNYYELTPVEEHGGILFKRDDLYEPFLEGDFGIRGGKVRQCLALVHGNLETIQRDFAGTISTAASVHSPQAVIVARVAKEFGLKCIIGHGAKDALKHRAMQMCVEYGAELVTLTTNNAYNNVLYGRLKKLAQTRPQYIINFGYQASAEKDSIIVMNAIQVQNLPDDLDMLVINVGSGVSAAGILYGLAEFDKKHLLEKVHLIQPFGYDRIEVVSSFLDFGVTRFQYHKGDYPYQKALKIKVGDVELDEVYEAKGYDYMMKNLPVQGKKVCYWIIGNANVLRS